jgi:hypothetical protein
MYINNIIKHSFIKLVNDVIFGKNTIILLNIILYIILNKVKYFL